MKVRFNGFLESKRVGGCHSCGKVGKSEHGFSHMKTVYLPSGYSKVFTMGEVYEVSDEDGRELLSYTQPVNGMNRKVFEEV